MATRRIISPRSPLGLPFRAILSRPYSSTSPARETVRLAFDHHTPQKGRVGPTESPIIFMHGLFGSKKNNRTVSKVLARTLGRHVYAVDLRNHGESGHAPRHDYLAMADDVAAFIHDRGLREPTLIGHSMGAKTAMTLSLKEPGLIKDIVSVDNAPVDAVLGTSFGRYIEAMRRIEEAGVVRKSDADKMLEQYEENLGVRHFLLANLHHAHTEDGSVDPTFRFRVPLDILARSLGHIGDFPFKDPQEARFEKPALFVRGTRSTYVPDEVIPVIGQFFPRFELVDIDAGHWVISEQPDKFIRGELRIFAYVVHFWRPGAN
ncbi:mitochondrial hydrolase [Daldinia caldariorum]|uniref:mitochondrial hydrolase n=1 Tax=Daldinia caldariorum TaxID=326644 RepID=UPI002008307F|nr:mitochondrial hydrolase [Daldinia caldariorum]KAI1468502.1 mitochondrial hydrolase [Daldinia caldariorum]